MQIRQHGLNFQILMSTFEIAAARRANKVVGRIPMSITDAEEAIRLLETQLREAQAKFDAQGIQADLVLTEREREQLRDLLVSREARRRDFSRGKFVKDAPDAISNVAAAIAPQDNLLPTEADLLEAFQTIAQAMVSDKYISEMFEASTVAAKEGLKYNELPEKDALRIIRAWISLKKSLEQQGYTVAWYERIKRRENNQD